LLFLAALDHQRTDGFETTPQLQGFIASGKSVSANMVLPKEHRPILS
jgi:hypothetical protein